MLLSQGIRRGIFFGVAVQFLDSLVGSGEALFPPVFSFEHLVFRVSLFRNIFATDCVEGRTG